MANNAASLYDTIFKTIEALKDKENPMDLARAKAISEAVQTAVNLAKVEVDHVKVTQGASASFFQCDKLSLVQPKITQHFLKG